MDMLQCCQSVALDEYTTWPYSLGYISYSPRNLSYPSSAYAAVNQTSRLWQQRRFSVCAKYPTYGTTNLISGVPAVVLKDAADGFSCEASRRKETPEVRLLITLALICCLFSEHRSASLVVSGYFFICLIS